MDTRSRALLLTVELFEDSILFYFFSSPFATVPTGRGHTQERAPLPGTPGARAGVLDLPFPKDPRRWLYFSSVVFVRLICTEMQDTLQVRVEREGEPPPVPLASSPSVRRILPLGEKRTKSTYTIFLLSFYVAG